VLFSFLQSVVESHALKRCLLELTKQWWWSTRGLQGGVLV